MKFNRNILILITFLAACNSNKSNEQSTEQKHFEPIEFPEFNAQFKNKEQLTVIDKRFDEFRLDSIQYITWSDNYTPYKTERGRLYAAYLYSVQPQLDKFAVLSLRTDADHWNKIHLVTVNQKLELVEKVQVSDNWAALLEQAGDAEIVGKQYMYTNMVSATEYRNFDIRTTETINYYSDSTTFEVDSIVTKIELLTNGTFKLTKLDSVRKVTHSNNL